MGIAIGLINFAKNFYDACMAIKFIQGPLAHECADDWYRSAMKQYRNRLSVALFLYGALNAYTIAKLWHVFTCPYSMFNVNGCAGSDLETCLNVTDVSESVGNCTAQYGIGA